MRFGIFAFPALLLATTAHANSYSKSWADTNYVPCEGLGLTASGKVSLAIEYRAIAAEPRREVINPVDGKSEGFIGGSKASATITAITVRTSYSHPHEPTGNLTWTDLAGRHRIVTLRRPWYDTIHSSADKDFVLVGPRAPDSLRNILPVTAQSVFAIASGTPVTLSITTRFPQNGGNCVSSFSQIFSSP